MRVFWTVLLIISGLLIFSNCTQKVLNKVDEPADLIPRDTMVNIVVDLRLMDAIIYHKQRKSDPAVSDFHYYLNNTILMKYNITREQFDNSFYYYENDLKVLDVIYADAITKLTLMKTEPEDE